MPYHIPEKRTEMTLHPYAECVEEACTFRAPCSALARDRAKDHVRYAGHAVRVVVEKIALWGPR